MSIWSKFRLVDGSYTDRIEKRVRAEGKHELQIEYTFDLCDMNAIIEDISIPNATRKDERIDFDNISELRPKDALFDCRPRRSQIDPHRPTEEANSTVLCTFELHIYFILQH